MNQAYQRVFVRTPPQRKDAILECGGADLRVVSRQRTGELTQEKSMTMRRSALQANLALDHKRRWNRALHRATKHYQGELHVGQPLRFWRRGANSGKKSTNAFWHPGVVISNTLATDRGSVVKCARSQVRPFHDDDETAHEHVTEHMRDLGERLPHEGDFPYEDITRHTENTGPSGKEQMDVEPEARRRMRGKTRPISPEQSTSALVNANLDAAPQEAERDHDDKRVDELVSPVCTVAHDEVSTLSPVPYVSETRDDEIAVDIALPEEPTGMSGESGQGWITEEAFFTVSPCGQQVRQRKEVKMNHLQENVSS